MEPDRGDGTEVRTLDPARFPVRCRTLLLACLESAFYVGFLPSSFARNEAILHEPWETYRIAALAFANCFVIEVLELLSAVDANHGEPYPVDQKSVISPHRRRRLP